MDVTLDVRGVDNNGLQARALVNEMMFKMPAMRPMVIVMKQFLRERGLNEPYNGGLSSYSITLLVGSVLQIEQQRHVRQKRL